MSDAPTFRATSKPSPAAPAPAPLELVFRQLAWDDLPPPEPGELYVRPFAPEHRGRRDLASLVLERGPGVFPRGEGTVRQLIVPTDPTLDDLLAALFTTHLLAGKELPAGAKAFARYAALAREGLKPSEIPLEVSLEGIYLAFRGAAGADLTAPAVAARFTADWGCMAACILAAATKGVDPFTTPLFDEGAEFARARAFLANDREVYRQDVLRGERWRAQLPGGPPESTGLLLRRPKSLLFKFWARRGEEAPGGHAFVLLAVDWGEGKWIFSTDPVHRLSLQTLAEVLQTAEAAAAGPAGPHCPRPKTWFDGKPFGHTLVAAPRGGTALPETKVLATLKKWAQVRPLRPSPVRRWSLPLAGLAAAVVLLVALLWPPPPTPHVISNPDDGRDPRWRGFDTANRLVADPTARGKLRLLAVGVSKYKYLKGRNLEVAHADALDLATALKKHSRGLFDGLDVTVLTDDKATSASIPNALRHLGERATPHDLVVVTFSGHGAVFAGNGEFYFLPHDYRDGQEKSRVYWSDLRRHLERMPCRVLLVLDTCHSGAVTAQLSDLATARATLSRQVNQAHDSGRNRGVVVLAACLGQGAAQESKKWKHGALTLALLEGITGKYLYETSAEAVLPRGRGKAGVISLRDLERYATDRVEELAGSSQAVVTNNTGNIVSGQIFLGARKPELLEEDARRSPRLQPGALGPVARPPLPGSGRLRASGNRYALLIGVNEYQHLGPNFRKLDGPGNDVELMRATLVSRFGFRDDPKYVRVLSNHTGREDPALLPTYANIKREFEALAKPGKLEPRDQVVILFAGHGSQQPADWSRPNNYEPDGLDEVFLPADAKLENDKWTHGITDDELRDWVDRLVEPKTGALVWVILDSCHSGTMLRSAGPRRARSVPLEQLIPAGRLRAARAEGARRFPAKQGAPERLGLTPDSPNLAALYACQADEEEYEVAPTEGKVYGLLTYAICSILRREASHPLTYLDLVNRIHTRYLALGLTAPTPMAEGKLCSTTVVNFEQGFSERSPMYVAREDGRWRVNAGHLHGLTGGSVLAVYAPGKAGQAAELLGYVEVASCQPTQCLVFPCDYGGRKANNEIGAKVRGLCKLVEFKPGRLRLPLAVSPLTAKGERLPEAQMKGLAETLRAVTGEKEAAVTLARGPQDDPWLWRLRQDSLASGRLYLVPPGGRRGAGGAPQGPIPEGAKRLSWLRERLGRLARAQGFVRALALWKDNYGGLDEGSEPVEVDFEMYVCRDSKDPEGKRVPPRDCPTLRPGDVVRFKVVNKNVFAVDVNLLRVGPDAGIRSVFPSAGGEDNRLIPLQWRSWTWKVPPGAAGVEHWGLLAVRAEPGAPQTNFLFLEQPSAEEATQRATRDSKRAERTGGLDALLLEALFRPTGPRRGLRGSTGGCAVELLAFECVNRL